jgi:hypothetical protein
MEPNKIFEIEELENRLEMANINGATIAPSAPVDDNSASTNQGCAQNSGCTADGW